ncbi:hypothetical protein [Nocardioides sp. R-C-SC26]|uniref:hypothetical protein n=1 Tax=Nocardioides sp. R-C-SC26 TaxID=2870414 RepID=UPI0022B77CAB|nr:hypothetical protein [Nocardioides sp. R-C-SC26]
MTGPEESRWLNHLLGCDDHEVGVGSREWDECRTLLDAVEKQLLKAASADEAIVPEGETGQSMAGAFSRAASAMAKRAAELQRGSEALGSAGGVISGARKAKEQLDRDWPPVAAPDAWTDPVGPWTDEDHQAKADHDTQASLYAETRRRREETSREWTTRMDEVFDEQTSVMEQIHGEEVIWPPVGPEDPYPTGPGRSPITTPTSSDDGSRPTRDPHITDTDGNGDGDDSIDTTNPTTTQPTTTQPPVIGPGTDVGPGVTAPTPSPSTAGPGGMSPAAVAGLGGAALLGGAGLVAGARAGLSLPGFGSARPGSFGATSRAAGTGSTLGRGTASGAARAGGTAGSARPGTAGSPGRAGAAGRGAGAAGGRGAASGGAGGRGAGRAGTAGAGGKGAGAGGRGGAGGKGGAGAAGGRGRGRDQREDARDRDLYDDGKDWLDDDGAPGVLA